MGHLATSSRKTTALQLQGFQVAGAGFEPATFGVMRSEEGGPLGSDETFQSGLTGSEGAVTLAQNGTSLTRSRCPVRARCDPFRGAFDVTARPPPGVGILLDDRRLSGWTIAMVGGQLL
jgi:hypothetical protein